MDSEDNIIILGDFNLARVSEITFTSEPSGLPGTWARGRELQLPITYNRNPTFYFSDSYDLSTIAARALNNSTNTTTGGSLLDYILTSSAVTVSGSEIYRSSLDTSNDLGLPKTGQPLDDNSSTTASDHYAIFADIFIEDAVINYSLTDATPSITESFDDFDGSTSPSRWAIPNTIWQGVYINGNDAGGYAIIDANDYSIGIIPALNPYVFSANFENNSSAPITHLTVSYAAQHHIVNSTGTTDMLAASYRIDDGPFIEIPDLSFTAHPDASQATRQSLHASLSDINLPIGSILTLQITASKGPPEEELAPDTAFINEFHYDNSNSDQGEFVEVVVSPTFSGNLNDTQVILYNGSNGNVDETHDLSTFDNFNSPTVSNGYFIYVKDIPGIQNGAPDGIALVSGGNVIEFISYEGSFTASNGPAQGMQSIDIGVSQAPPNPAGTDALGLSGNGSQADEFSWTQFQGIPYSKGLPNTGQTFTGASQAPSQVLAFDNVILGITSGLIDTDNDGTPDISDLDDDNDGLSDAQEELLGTKPLVVDTDNNGIDDGDEDFDHDGQTNLDELWIVQTDPLDGNSKFEFSIRYRSFSNELELFCPTLPGRNYQLWLGSSLFNLAPGTIYPGDGNELIIPVSEMAETGFFYIEVSLDELP